MKTQTATFEPMRRRAPRLTDEQVEQRDTRKARKIVVRCARREAAAARRAMAAEAGA